jgi:Flp pilus assembly protein TadD
MSPTDDSISADTVKANGEFPVEACYAAGLEALNKGDLEEAHAWAVRCEAASHGGTDARCAMLLGLIATEAGDLEVAASHLRQAMQLAPDDVSIARRLGEVLATSGTWSEAAATLERAAVSTPGDIDLLVDLGYACMMSGDRARARAALERAASLRPADAVIQYSLAQFYEAMGEPALAAAVLIPLTQHAASPRLLSDLTLLLLRLERWNEAEAYFIRLQWLDPDHYLIAQHGRIWCRIREQNWRGAFDLALEATRLDRYDLTTALLDYVKDRLFGQVLDSARREAELGERIMAELLSHAEQHADEHIAGGTGVDKEAAHG